MYKTKLKLKDGTEKEFYSSSGSGGFNDYRLVGWHVIEGERSFSIKPASEFDPPYMLFVPITNIDHFVEIELESDENEDE